MWVRGASVAAGVMRGANVQPGFIQPGLRGGRSPAAIGGGGGESQEGVGFDRKETMNTDTHTHTHTYTKEEN